MVLVVQGWQETTVLYCTVLYCTVLQGWQETTDAALTFLLRTALAKPGRENQGATPITLEPAKETTRYSTVHNSTVQYSTVPPG